MEDYLLPFGTTGSLLYNLQFDTATKTAFEQAKAKAAVSDKKWEKVLNYVLTYGDRAVTILSKNGIIPNKNVQTILKAQYDQNALAQLLAANGGALTGAPEQLTDRSANIFGMNTSTLILIAAALLLFFTMQNSKN